MGLLCCNDTVEGVNCQIPHCLIKTNKPHCYKAIPINCFVSHRPTDPLLFKVPFKENITDPYFGNFSENKKVFNLKELHYFEIIF